SPIKSASWIEKCSDAIDVPAFTVDDTVEVEITEKGECRKDGAFDMRDLVVVGVGTSKTPAATTPILLVDHYEQYNPKTGDYSTTRDAKLTFSGDGGVLEMGGKANGLE